MADCPPSFADSALINAATALVTARVFDAAEEKMILAVLGEVIASANWDHTFIGPLVEAVRHLLAARPVDGVSLRYQHGPLITDIESAVVRVARWRLGASLEHFHVRKAAS